MGAASGLPPKGRERRSVQWYDEKDGVGLVKAELRDETFSGPKSDHNVLRGWEYDSALRLSDGAVVSPSTAGPSHTSPRSEPGAGKGQVVHGTGNNGGRGGNGGKGGSKGKSPQSPQSPQSPLPLSPHPDFEATLNKMIGLQPLKVQLRSFEQKVKADVTKRQHGHQTVELIYHMCLMGNPGTGKTSVARLLHDLLRVAGVLAYDAPFIELKPSHAEGSNMGEARENVQKFIDRAKGGVLFADEAHNLTLHKDNMYGQQAASQLMDCLQDKDMNVIVVYAGTCTPNLATADTCHAQCCIQLLLALYSPLVRQVTRKRWPSSWRLILAMLAASSGVLSSQTTSPTSSRRCLWIR